MDEMKEFMPEQESVQLADNQMRQMILAIKKTKAEKHLSYQNIVDGCEKNGDYVSMSSVRRVCADGSENQRFRYDATLRPIARFVLGLDDSVPASEAADQDGPAANELLRVVVSIKEDTIADMKRGIEEREAELSKVRAEYEDRLAEKDRVISHLKGQVNTQQEDINARIKGTRRRTLAIVILGILLVISMAVTIIYLSWDLTHPTQGYFQWETSSMY